MCFLLVAFIREHTWHKALLMRLEVIHVSSLNVFQLVMGLYGGNLIGF